MRKKWILLFGLVASLLLNGCAMVTVDRMYAVPRRSAEYQSLQRAVDRVLAGAEYCAPLSGENRQTVQMADLNGDGRDEYLLFARSDGDNPLKIYIFSREGEDYTLRHTLENQGAGFEQVEYVDLDGLPGQELVVGRQVSDQVLRSLSVYSFAEADARLLMTVHYDKFVTADLDADDRTDLLILSPGDSEERNGVATLYRYEDGTMARSRQAVLSAGCENIKRIMVSRLHGQVPAVYVASSQEGSAIITDVFAMKNGTFTNVSLSNESGTSVQTLRNHYIYAMDMDADGALELPALIPMQSMTDQPGTGPQHLIRWYTMTVDGEEVDKVHTFHTFDGGWYLILEREWADRVTVTRSGDTYTFYVWDLEFAKTEKLLTVTGLAGSDWDGEYSPDPGFWVLKTDTLSYAVKLETAALSYGLNEENLQSAFHLIRMDWKTGET